MKDCIKDITKWWHRMFVKLIALCFILLFCISCDAPIITLEKDNFGWSENSTNRFDMHVNSYFVSKGTKFLSILRWKGKGQLGHLDNFVILTFKKEGSYFILQNGIVLETVYFKGKDELATIGFLRVLKPDYFYSEGFDKGSITIKYNGPVSDKSIFDKGQGRNWLRFEVKAVDDKNKVVSVVNKLFPLLEKEPAASDIFEELKIFF